MSRKKKSYHPADEKVENQLPDLIKDKLNEMIQNGTFGNGQASFDPFGFPGNQAFPGSEQISNSDTLFKNLRWYLVSNFRQLISQLYVEIGLVQTIVDVPVDDALRGGINIKSKMLDEEQIEELQISVDRDNDLNAVGQAAKWNRLFGGGGLVIMTDQDPEEPFELDQVDKDTPLEFRPVDLWELFWDKQNTEGYDPSLQMEEFDHYNYYGENLQKSRVMRMKGITPPSFIRPRLRGWGMSIVEVLVRSINQYLKATDLGFEVLDEFKIDVYKIKNLVNTLVSPQGAQSIRKRLYAANRDKNYLNAIVMDAEDDYDHKQLSFAGLAEAMAGIRMQVASDLRMPIIKLFGQSVSAGMSESSQTELENYNSMVESEVRGKIKYDILRVLEIKCQKLFGFVPDDLSIEFKPLRVLSAEQEENVKTQKANRIVAFKTAMLLTDIEARDAINKGNLLDIKLDTEQDMLNPDDPQVDEIVKEGEDRDPKDTKDQDDPGANRVDTKKPRATDTFGIPKGGPEKPKKNEITIMPRVYTRTERAMRAVRNSIEYDKAAYAADGGDSWIDPRRLELFMNPGRVDEGLWSKAKDASQKAWGKIKWAFVVWWYKKQGGVFH